MSFLSKNIRTLLTFKYTIVVALLMFAYSAINLAFQYYYLSKQVDLNLKEDLEIIQEILLTNEIIINPMEKLSDHSPKPYERFVEIWAENGTKLYHSSAFQFEQHPAPPNPQKYSTEPQYFSVEFASGEKWRTIGALVITPNNRRIIRISMSEEQLFTQLLDIFSFMSVLTPLFLIFAIITGYILARQALKPIDVMVAQAKRIETGDLRERLTVVNPQDELGNLALVLNELFDRIQRSFQQLKHFTADASHELRTPLTAMRSVGEVGLQNGQSPEYYKEVIGSMLEENARLTHLVDSLLFLSKADSDRVALKLEEVDLEEFLRETKEILEILAHEKQQEMTLVCSNQIRFTADKALLRRAVLNLVDNAIKYSPEKGMIVISGYIGNNGTVVISVEDSGDGVPNEFTEKIFDRFFRIDKDRSRETGGVGLGLSIVQWVMSVHHGSVKVESKSSGSVFYLELPLHQTISV